MRTNVDEKAQTLKLLLLDGRRLTVSELDDILKTNNSPQVVNRLRKSGVPVQMEWKTNPNTKTRYGVYFLPKEKKENRILNQTYSRA